LRRNDADAHSHGLFANQTGQRFPLFGVQLLAIPNQPEPGHIGGVGQDNSAGYYGASQSPPPDLIYASDKLIALGFELIFFIMVRKLRQDFLFHNPSNSPYLKGRIFR
jgi:hypothetical protein